MIDWNRAPVTPEDPRAVEIRRLRAINADLLAVCKAQHDVLTAIVETGGDERLGDSIAELLDGVWKHAAATIAKAKEYEQ